MDNESEMDTEPRVGSFLPTVIPMRKPWRRSNEMERRIIRRELWECVRLNGELPVIEQEMQRRMEKADWRDLAEEFEWFTLRLLEGLKARGMVEWHVWQKVCFDTYKVDVHFGVDHFGELTDAYGKVFFMINTKATEEALDKYQKKGRAGILGFRARCSLAGATEQELRREEDRLLEEIIGFFGVGAV